MIYILYSRYKYQHDDDSKVYSIRIIRIIRYTVKESKHPKILRLPPVDGSVHFNKVYRLCTIRIMEGGSKRRGADSSSINKM